MTSDLVERLRHEREHAQALLANQEKNWNWHTHAGKIRYRRRLEYLMNILPPEKRASAKVIEVGAGTGTYSGSLGNVYPNLVSIDISPDLLEKARIKHPNIHFQVMDAHELDVPEHSIDAVLGCSILHHLDWEKALRNYFGKLVSGGKIRFSEPNLLNPQVFLQKKIPWLKKLAGDSVDEYAFTRFEIERSLRDSGFSKISIKPFEFLHPATPRGLIPALICIERFCERTPLREIGGSLLIEAQK